MKKIEIVKPPKIGDNVELFDKSHKGEIVDMPNEKCLKILWDDEEIGWVHPDDVNIYNL